MQTKKFYNGFTIVELIIGLLFTAMAGSAIIVGTGHYYKTISNLKLKEAAYERLKGYTEYQKGKIAAGEIRNNSCESGEELCLGSIGEDEDCTFEANDLCFYITESTASQNSKAKRYELLTKITWDNINEEEKEMSFYAIQIVY